ncbi:MAG TPA: radical SAM protein [Microvirga sp.]|nr:radical SAM protein [Microvirga sp.]
MFAAARPQPRRFQLVLIKPSHYHDDGYVVQWARAVIPSNTLAVLYSLGRDAAQRSVLGPDTAIDITVIDEINSRVKINKLLAQFRRNGGFGLLGIVGVQSNQFPRALDIARPFRAAGVPVIVGGFHVSGCLAMLPELQADLKVALDMGVSLFAGELEGRMDTVLTDAANGTLKPIYNYLKDLPALESEPTPILPPKHLRRTIQSLASFDAGRGCPYQCSFCTIINVQGRKSRGRTADDVERTIREHWAQGIRHFFITDDNLARHKDWESIFDRIIELREREGLKVKLMVQVDTLCHKIPNFIEKATRAGTNRVLVGMESINAANLVAAKKRQNKITEYRKMLLAWKNAGAITTAGYILGFPFDTPESIREDIEIIKKELPLDILEFFILTPLPGSEDHKVLYSKGAWMDPDMNRYDGEHAVSHHPTMSKEVWEEVYQSAWRAYYTPEHMRTLLRRGAAAKCSMSRLVAFIYMFASCVPIEGVHPLQGGVLRRKYRRDRRPGMPLEPVWSFYPKYAAELVTKTARQIGLVAWLCWTKWRIETDRNRLAYTDQALTPVRDDEEETLALFTHSDAARKAVEHARKVAHLTGANSREADAAPVASNAA